MIDPDFTGILNSDSITNIGKDLGDLYVADDDVGDVDNAKTDTKERYKSNELEGGIDGQNDGDSSLTSTRLADDRGVGPNLDHSISGNSA